MLQAVKRLVGADRSDTPTPTTPKLDREALEAPVRAARDKCADIEASHSESMTALHQADEAIRQAQQAFDAADTNDNLQAVKAAKRTREELSLRSERTARLAHSARNALAAAELARAEAVHAHLDAIIGGAPARAEALWLAKGKPAMQAVADFLTELDAVLAEAQGAASEAYKGNPDLAHAKTMGINSVRSVVRSLAARDIRPASIVAIERLVGG